MINDIRIQLAILMYLVGCFSLMLYNAVTVYRKNKQQKSYDKQYSKYVVAIFQQFPSDVEVTTLSPKHIKYLKKSLLRVENLISYFNTLNYIKIFHRSNIFDKYIVMLVQSGVFNTLAIAYRQKKNEERAYFAYFISQYPHLATNTEGICTDTINTMVAYITDSDIYCRANVLKALCRIGDIHGIVNVLQSFSDQQNFVHHRLLAEELYNFAGDKEVLALYLWGKYKVWNDNVMLGVITFITMFSDEFKSVFLPVLQNKSTCTEIRLAIIQYYKQYYFKPVGSVLIECLSQTENYDLAMEAASTLSMYPGTSTTIALTFALQSENWYVQYNAAYSLVALGEHSNSFIADLTSSNSDARHIIRYMLEHTINEKEMNVSEVII